MIATLCAAAILAPSIPQDAWSFKFAQYSKATLAYDVKVQVSDNGEDHTATMRWIMKFPEITADKTGKFVIVWEKLTVDENEIGDQGPWEFALSANGVAVESMDDDGYRLMNLPFTLPYAEDAKVGAEWKFSAKPKNGSEAEWTCKAEAVEKIGDQETLKVLVKMAEKDKDGMQADGAWWMRRDGKPQRFRMKVVNWHVPMSDTAKFDADITGELAK